MASLPDQIENRYSVANRTKNAVPIRSENDVTLAVDCSAQILEAEIGFHPVLAFLKDCRIGNRDRESRGKDKYRS